MRAGGARLELAVCGKFALVRLDCARLGIYTSVTCSCSNSHLYLFIFGLFDSLLMGI